MENLLKTPLLPQCKVTVAAVGAKYSEIIDSLRKNYDIDIFCVPENSFLESSISSHPDCVMVTLDKNSIVVEKNTYSRFVNFLTNRRTKIIDKINILQTTHEVKSPYPSDTLLNIRVIGNKIMCNTKYTDDSVREFALNNNFKLIHCNQGYAACSSIVLNDTALITDDESIYNASVLNGLDCLKVNKGSVKLDGHTYGFIGGTCGMIEKNLLAFTGKLNSHTDYIEIRDFLKKYHIEYVELTAGPLTDIGGIIPIFEECV